MRKLNVQSSRPPKVSNDSTVNQTLNLPHPLQDLTGVRLRTKHIRESVYDQVIERDAKIFERLAKSMMELGLYFPSRQLVEEKHDFLVNKYGGSLGIRYDNALEYALARPLNVLLYSEGKAKDLFDVATAFAYGLRRSHPFVDGNKRTSWLTMQTFLADNKVEVIVDPGDAETYMLRLANLDISEEGFAAWLRAQWIGSASA